METFENKPPFLFERNEFGLLKHIEHKFKDDGTVDWKRMISDDYYVPNEERTEEKDVTKLEDCDKLILLFGFKAVSTIAGINAINYYHEANNDICSVVCQISWLDNYEVKASVRPLISSGIGDATDRNTTGFGKDYPPWYATGRSLHNRRPEYCNPCG